MKEVIKRIPFLGALVQRIYWRLFAPDTTPEPFPGSEAYWEKRYSVGGNSG